MQRAFAVQLLMPINDLVDYLDGDHSPDAINEAGEHFRVSPWAVSSHLVNHRIIPSATTVA